MLKTFTLTGTLLACLAFNAPAGVQITKFDPPLTISAFADIVPGTQPFNVLPVDFNLDSVDFRLAYGLGAMGAYFNAPTRYAVRVPQPPPNGTIRGGLVGAVPFGAVIGSNIVSSIRTNYFVWSEGYTNQYDLTQPFGDHEATVIVANVIPMMEGGTLQTVLGPVQTPPFPAASGDVVGKAGVIALEIYLNGQPHYGYIQFDFRSNGAPLSGTGGLIYGWAYETEPGVPIFAAPIGDKFDRTHGGNRKH